MQRAKAPIATLAVLLVLWWLHLRHFLPLLPARVATHFDGSGTPNGWMPRSALGTADFLFTTIIVGVTLGAALLVRLIPVSLINVPNRDYWFAPERRRDSHDRLTSHLLWLPGLLVAFLTGINHVVVLANLRRGDVHLGGPPFVLLLAAFAAAMIAWVVRMFRLFPRPPRT